MAKTPSDKLHRLIHTLSSTEKRYFRIYIRGKTDRDSKYLQLFDLLDAARTYNSEVVKTKIYGSQASEDKKYSELKAYLYDLILKCLQSFDEQHSVESKLHHFLQSVSVLFKRGLYDDCSEILQKSAKLARQHERFAYQLEIIAWEKHLAYTRMDVGYLHTQLEVVEAEERHVLNQLANFTDYRQVFFGMYAAIKKEAIHQGEDRLTYLRTIVRAEMFASTDQAISHRARVLYFRSLNLYHYATQDLHSFYQSGLNLVQLIENEPVLLKENLSDYIAALSNFILACGMLERYEEVRAALQKIRKLKPLTEDDRRKIHRQYYTVQFALSQFTGEFEAAKTELEACQAEAVRLQSHDYETASFYFQYCYICFGCDDYDGALNYLNQWLAQPRSVEREDLQSLARILEMILHFELGNYLLLESVMRSARRFMKRKKRLFEVEIRFIHLMQDLIRANSVAEKKTIFALMQVEWHQIPGSIALSKIFDLEAWLLSKASGSTFAEVVRQRWEVKSQKRKAADL